MESVDALFLELEASGELDLTLTEQSAVSAGNTQEWRVDVVVEYQALRQSARAGRCARVRREIVEGARHGCDLRSIEYVERFTKNFESGTFRDPEATREPQINVPNLRLRERIAW